MALVLTVLPALLVSFDGIVTDTEYERIKRRIKGRRRIQDEQSEKAI